MLTVPVNHFKNIVIYYCQEQGFFRLSMQDEHMTECETTNYKKRMVKEEAVMGDIRQ
jgi:hypothetical protein